MTRGPRRMRSFWRSSSLSLRGFPLKSRTRQPGVSRLSRWSRASCLTPFNCLKTSYGPCVNTQTSLRQMRQQKWLGLPAASVALLKKNRPTSSAPRNFFSLCVRFDCTQPRGWLASDSSALVSPPAATCGPEVAAPCPKCWRTACNSVNWKLQWKEES